MPKLTPTLRLPLRLRHRRVALALSLDVVLGCRQRSTDPSVLIAQAWQHRQHGDTNAAVIALKQALQIDPQNRAARHLLGKVYIDQADSVSAEKELRRALALGAPSTELLLLLGKSILYQGRFQRVLDELNSTPDPQGRPALLALRGSALLGLGKTGHASALFKEALQTDAAMPDALLGLARIAFAARDPGQADALVARALAAHPEDADCLRFKGDLLRIEGKPQAALDTYRAILARHPWNAQARVDVATLLTDSGKFLEAQAELQAARNMSPGRLSIFYAQAMLDYRRANYAAAAEALQQLLQSAPDYYPAILLLGAVELAMGANGLAEEHIQHFLTAYPGHLHATKLMATLHLRANKAAAMLELVERALAQHADDVDLMALAGEANIRLRNFSHAADYFERAGALYPRQSNLHTTAVISRLGNGEHERALAELEHAASLDSAPLRTGTLVVMSYLRTRQLDKALSAVQHLERQGDSAQVQNLKGGVFLARQDIPAARASFEKALVRDPLHLPALDNLAQLDVLEQRADNAQRRYLAALAKAPKHTPLMEALARLVAGQGQMAEAMRWSERACRENPESLALALRLVDYTVRAGDSARALVLAQKLQASHPASPEVLVALAQLLTLRDNLPAAAEAYAKLALLPASTKPTSRISALQPTMHDEAAALAGRRGTAAACPAVRERLLARRRPQERTRPARRRPCCV
jgi:putative PEP-CTERM system TPR-repeat lipoprotein